MSSPEMHDYDEPRPLPTSGGRDIEIAGEVLPAEDQLETSKPGLSEAQIDAQVEAIIEDDMQKLRIILSKQDDYDRKFEDLVDKLGSSELARSRLGSRPEVPEYLAYLVDDK